MVRSGDGRSAEAGSAARERLAYQPRAPARAADGARPRARSRPRTEQASGRAPRCRPAATPADTSGARTASYSASPGARPLRSRRPQRRQHSARLIVTLTAEKSVRVTSPRTCAARRGDTTAPAQALADACRLVRRIGPGGLAEQALALGERCVQALLRRRERPRHVLAAWVRKRTCASFDRRASASSSRQVGTERNVAPAIPESPLDTEEVTTIPPTASVARIPRRRRRRSRRLRSRGSRTPAAPRGGPPGARALSSVAGGDGSATAPPALGAPAALSPPSKRCSEAAGASSSGGASSRRTGKPAPRPRPQPHQQRRRRPERRQQHPARRARARPRSGATMRSSQRSGRRSPPPRADRAEPGTRKRSRAPPPARPAPARRDRPGRIDRLSGERGVEGGELTLDHGIQGVFTASHRRPS